MIETAVLPFVIRRLTPAVQAEMRRLIEALRSHADEPMKADTDLMEFHLLMLRSCGNRVMEVFAMVVRTYFYSTKHLVENVSRDFFLERADLFDHLLAALTAEDLPKAADVMRRIILGNSALTAPAGEESGVKQAR